MTKDNSNNDNKGQCWGEEGGGTLFGCSGGNGGNARSLASSVSSKQQSTDDQGEEMVMATSSDTDQWGRRGT